MGAVGAYVGPGGFMDLAAVAHTIVFTIREKTILRIHMTHATALLILIDSADSSECAGRTEWMHKATLSVDLTRGKVTVLRPGRCKVRPVHLINCFPQSGNPQ